MAILGTIVLFAISPPAMFGFLFDVLTDDPKYLYVSLYVPLSELLKKVFCCHYKIFMLQDRPNMVCLTISLPKFPSKILFFFCFSTGLAPLQLTPFDVGMQGR